MPSFDAYAPREMVQRVETACLAKSNLSLVSLLALSVLAGAFIAFGAILQLLVTTNHGLGFGPARLLGGLVFSLGLVLVVVGGAELFTGNALLTMAWADRRISLSSLLRNWTVVYVGNFAGALGMGALTIAADILLLDNGAVGANAIQIASAKAALSFDTALVRGILCNILVCLAVWLSFAARDVPGKILAVVFPITAFVALGFEHSVANMYLIPLAIYASHYQGIAPPVDSSVLSAVGLFRNLVPVTLGNIFGGGVLVALTYYLVYGWNRQPTSDDKD
jgi:formate transporter